MGPVNFIDKPKIYFTPLIVPRKFLIQYISPHITKGLTVFQSAGPLGIPYALWSVQ